ncbi:MULTISPECIES: DUF2642 domain-containing protein [Paenibacillus]|uniref:DUF2642 domain-containing protein n=1 Tax=Paenibacillus lactis 154 TaxID=743719 RepID=G4HPC3_9BACL|nr:DUF2642 domain-containing protein [Paenibacillus lactis]EHB48568.1 hypothetical protein PaelaDRAFT_5834 [Paenibacillus lactis 154]MCM3497321.1 YuzF family protein [Paenibacillus lactis]
MNNYGFYGYPPPTGYSPSSFYSAPPTTPGHLAPRASAVPLHVNYVTLVEPMFMDHLLKHKGAKITVVTTAGKVEGILSGVTADHIQLTVGDNKALHIRLAQVVYFEGVPY